MPSQDLNEVAESFNRFAQACHDSSPLYETLSLKIALDQEILQLAAQAKNQQPRANLLFAAVQYLLLKGYVHKLSRFYPRLSTTSNVTLQMRFDPYPYFREFCLANKNQITAILKTRLVQTNEVNRCALLLPAFHYLAGQAKGLPLALIEIGAAAGLNLLFDRYAYDYGTGIIYGQTESEVQLACELKGKHKPALSKDLPEIDSAIGIDLNPLDPTKIDDVLWLKALVWPEQKVRYARLNAALNCARQAPPTVLAGDALHILTEQMDKVSADSAICIYHCHTLNQFSDEAKTNLNKMLSKQSEKRPVFEVSVEWLTGPTPKLTLNYFQDGKSTITELGLCDQHGQWLEWLIPEQI